MSQAKTRVLLPISLDRVASPISTLLREVAKRIPSVDFYGFSSPLTDEDREESALLWELDWIHQVDHGCLARVRFDFVWNASATPRNLIAVKLAKLRSLGGVKHIYTANCEPYATDPYLKYFRKAVSVADIVVSVSESVAKGVERDFGRCSDHVIPNGFSEELYTLPEKRELSPVPRFLWAAQILDRKNPKVFLDLAAQRPEFEFLMVGNNPYPDSDFARRTLERIESARNVTYLGKITRLELRDLLQSSHALLFPSDFEGLPLTVVEASACGCPVVAQPTSALPEAVTDGVNGWLRDKEDGESWLNLVDRVASWTSQDFEVFGKAARDHVRASFSWDTIAKRYESVFHESADEGIFQKTEV